MSKNPPRLRMFAGPNGSGKSTLKSVIREELLGTYVNPDVIEKEINDHHVLDFTAYGVKTTREEVLGFFENSPLLEESPKLEFSDHKLLFPKGPTDSYTASVAADFIRQKLLDSKQSFSFETVMSHPDKVELLRKAQAAGYRTYLYYVATEDPSINIARIEHRVKMGGHPVPHDKVISRYERSLDLLLQATRTTNRAYVFDNSGLEPLFLAAITDGKILEIKADPVPVWFKTYLLDKLPPP